MIKRTLTLYASRTACLCLVILLSACTSTQHIHYQALSDAKQALTSAKSVAKKTKSPEDQKELTLAKGILDDGETALNEGKYATATALFETSKKHSQAILKRQQPNATANGSIKFRY